MTVPVVIVLAFALAAITGSHSASNTPAGAVVASVPPQAAAQTASCTKLIEKLPVTLDKLAPREVHTNPITPFVEAWGDPAVILRCGVERPAALHPDSAVRVFPGGPANGPFFIVEHDGSTYVWTSVDRTPYISVTVPTTYQGASVMGPLADAIAAALPPVCSTVNTDPVATLCTRRRS